MAVPALVIGIGGTGQWVLTYLKKDLVETYGEIPAGVKLLAFDMDRADARTIGGIVLEPWEHVRFGGDLGSYLSDIALHEENQLFPHVQSWFKVNNYLSLLPNGQPDFTHVDIPIGASRQLARLAIFRDLQSPASKVLVSLKKSIRAITRETNCHVLNVFLVGSLAGATGAGMCIDIAHLARHVAKEHGHVQIFTYGFLVLSDVFGSLPETIAARMKSRSFAAMREIRRFSEALWDMGYPMHYVAPTPGRAGDPVLLGSIKGQPFDHLYYIDGHRKNFPLYAIPIENGVAPTIADMISAMLDKTSFGSFEEHTRNLYAVLASRRSWPYASYCASLGTYSIVFPIHSIIEGYAHRLSLEALQHLLQPNSFDDSTTLPTHLAGDKNYEAGQGYSGLDAARAFLVGSSVIDPSNSTVAVDNTLLTADLVDAVERFTVTDMSIVGRLAARSPADWERIFIPTGESMDVLAARQLVEGIIGANLRATLPTSKNLKRRESPADSLYRIENGVRSHKNIYLGVEQKETGQRVSGKYREALGEYTNVHLKRFQKMLDYKMREVLNGRSNAAPMLAKSGKLGYLQEFLAAVSNYLDRGYQVMTRVMEYRRYQARGRMQAIAVAQNALNEMKANANDTRPIVGKAHKSQEAYLEAEQLLIDIHKVEIMEQAVTDTIKQMQEMVASAKASADAWAQTLGIGQGSLYAALVAGKRQMDANRNKDADVESRLVLGARKAGKEEDAEYTRFREYEERRYRHYVYEGQTNQVAALLGDLNWQVSTEVKAGELAFKLGLSITSEGAAKPSTLEDSAGKNLGLILGRAQQAFKDALRDESVVGYLMYAYESPEVLADLIHARSGPLLDHDASGPIPANYLRATFGQESGQADYLRGVLRRLASHSYIADMDRFAKLVNSENRFACTLVHTMDLIEIDRMAAYTNGLQEYMGLISEDDFQRSLRSPLHCFPAEVNAVQYEERLPLLNQASRMLHDDIVLQLEKEDNLRLFLFCWGYRLISTHAFDDAGETKTVYRLQWETDDDRDIGEVWLTKPQKDKAPDFLEALMTFNYVGHDVGHGDTYLKRIEWDRVRSTLEQRYQDDLAARRATGNLGASDVALGSWLSAQQIPDDDPVWLLTARLDRLSEMDKKLTEIVADLDKQFKDPAHRENEDLQKQYDLASVFLLVLLDEQEKIRLRIHNRQREI